MVPMMDHHQHLLSPAALVLEARPTLPQVKVPAEIAELLKQRAERTADADRLALLYSEDVLLHGFGEGGWIRGNRDAAEFISSTFAPGYRLTPVSYRNRGALVEVAGYYTRGEGAMLRHPGYFSMNLVKDRAGSWRIAAETPVFPGPLVLKQIDGKALVEMLDLAGIKRAVVLSNAYWFDRAEKGPKQYEQVRAENDWTAEQVAMFPDRLIGFCSFSPLADYALTELERCAAKPQFKGLKLHLGSSGVDLTKPDQAAKVRRVVEAANRLKLPVIAHLTATRDYGRKHSEIFLSEILPAAPDIPVIIAHLWGGAAYSDDALSVYVDAIKAGHPATKNLYFEVAQASLVEGNNDSNLRKIAERIREIGLDRILYGSDGAMPPGLAPTKMWADFRVKVPLTDDEFRRIANNVLPGLQ
jgi:predicted TIM-barrel fold metal-dependent hydrolase